MNNINNLPRLESFSLTDQGRRPNNEDFIAFFEPTGAAELQKSGCIYIVADGVGGASIGERASKFAAEKVLYEYLQHPEVEPSIRLKQAIVKANREIFEYAEQNGIRMATTMTVAVVIGNQLIAANVGDSRIYRIRGGDVKQVTNDHNIVGELVRNGAMSEEEALRSKMKNKLTRSIGGSDEVVADTFVEPLLPNDRILLCSDGLTRYALRQDIAKLSSGNSAKQITTDAVDFAKKKGHGGADNISVITVIYEPSEDKGLVTAPPESWELRETVIERRPRPKEEPKLPPFAILAALVLLLIATGGGVTAFIYRGTLFGSASTPSATSQSSTPVVTETLTTTPTLTPMPMSTDTPTATLAPTDTPSPFTVSVTQSCDPRINIRSYPSKDSSIAPVIGGLRCGDTVTLRGRYLDSLGEQWLQIHFPDVSGNEQSAWVHASLISVPENVAALLPVIVDVPIPTQVVPTIGIEIEGMVQCRYTVAAQGEGLIVIANKFGIQDTNVIYCAPGDNGGCAIDHTAQDPVINVGWTLIIPNIDAAKCTDNGGIIQQ